MVIGYARSHSRDSDLRLQRAALQKAGCEFIIEIPDPDVKSHRLGLMRALDTLSQGDTLIVRRFDRLASSLRQWMAVSAILQDRGIKLRVLEDGAENAGSNEDIVGRMLSAMAAYEQARRQKRPRTKRRRGRPRGMDEAKRAAALKLKNETSHSITEICHMVGISRQTFYRYCRIANTDTTEATRSIGNSLLSRH